MTFEAIPIVWHNLNIVEHQQAYPSMTCHALHLSIGVFDGTMAYWNRNH